MATIKAFDGIDLHYEKDIPQSPKCIILIIHGVAEHLGRYSYVKDRLNSFGYGVYRFDNRGHGKSGGARGHINNFKEFILDADRIVDLIQLEYPSIPIYMLGHSMGGFIAASYAVSFPGKLQGQILSGAATNKIPMKTSLKSINLKYLLRGKVPNSLSHLVCTDLSVVRAYEDDPLVLKETSLKLMNQFINRGIPWLLERLSSYTSPCLILHGEEDKIVPKSFSEHFYKEIYSSDKELKIYPGLYHEIFNEPTKETILEDIHQWIEERLS